MKVFSLLIIPILLSVSASANQCRLRPFHLQDQIYGSCPDFADLSPKNESNYAIAAGPFPCGSCVQVSYQNRQLHVIIVDSISSPGLDLHLDPMVKLSGTKDPTTLIEGLLGCQAEIVSLEMCNPNITSTNIPVGNFAGQAGFGAQQQIPKQPWMNPAAGFGQMNVQQGFQQPQQPVYQPKNLFGVRGDWQQQQQQQQPNLMQANPLQPQQRSWQFPSNQQLPPNVPMFLRRKTQIRVYD